MQQAWKSLSPCRCGTKTAPGRPLSARVAARSSCSYLRLAAVVAQSYPAHYPRRTAHEVGHQFGLNHEPDGDPEGWRGDYGNPDELYLMAGEADFTQYNRDLRDFDTFDPPSINDIRSIDHPISD